MNQCELDCRSGSLYFCTLGDYTKNRNMEREYVVPQIEVLQFQSEGLLCASNEMLGENDGEW